jgi:hypothetical protein
MKTFDFLGERYPYELVEGIANGSINPRTNEIFGISNKKSSKKKAMSSKNKNRLSIMKIDLDK